MIGLSVGQKRNFTFKPERKFVLREIQHQPDISMDWIWNNGTCPHCKNKLDIKKTHKFFRIEILTDSKVDDDDLTIQDLVCLGFSEDGKILLLDKNTSKEALEYCNIEKIKKLKDL